MQAPLSRRTIGCIGKCTSGLKREELDQITDNIDKTLAHPCGRQIFRRYLEQRSLTDDLECLNLYETCLKSLKREQSSKDSNLELLKSEVEEMQENVVNLYGVPEIDVAFLIKFEDAVNSECRITMIEILKNTNILLSQHLRGVHENFKQYASEPCPMTK